MHSDACSAVHEVIDRANSEVVTAVLIECMAISELMVANSIAKTYEMERNKLPDSIVLSVEGWYDLVQTDE